MLKFIRSFIFLTTMMSSVLASAYQVPIHGGTAEQRQEKAIHNERLTESSAFIEELWKPIQRQAMSVQGVIPYAEYEEAGYLIFSDPTLSNWKWDEEAKAAKLAMAKNLPDNVTLVVFTGNRSKSHEREIRNFFKNVINDSRMKVIYLPGAERGFWTRDGIPVPVWSLDFQSQDAFTVVDARYYHHFEADEEVSKYFSAKLFEHDYYYEGGNFMANHKGDCFMIDNKDASAIPTDIFQSLYGCKSLIRFPHKYGIGHADEVLKFIDEDTVITIDESYAQTLRENGFEVVMMPRPDRSYETYINSLIVNGTVFVPVYDQKNDAKALKIYESFGLNVVPLKSINLSNKGLGSIHCITMTYPEVEFRSLVDQLDGEEL